VAKISILTKEGPATSKRVASHGRSVFFLRQDDGVHIVPFPTKTAKTPYVRLVYGHGCPYKPVGLLEASAAHRARISAEVGLPNFDLRGVRYTVSPGSFELSDGVAPAPCTSRVRSTGYPDDHTRAGCGSLVRRLISCLPAVPPA
jgi:hypothetical protein